jgi:3-dehydroshikimate dehydratase
MNHPGLVSVTFRALTPSRIIELVREAGLECIEWGGDVHVPHGDLQRAREVRGLTEAAGLRVSSYGSYYRIWPREPVSFDVVLETAIELGAPRIRVWAGRIGSAQADAEHWQHVIDESRGIGEKAAQAGIGVAYEYHNNTLTDTRQSVLRLLREVAHPNIFSFWQPPVQLSGDENMEGLEEILPWLRSVHVFAWQAAQKTGEQALRLPLAAKEDEWRAYLEKVSTTGRDHDILLEFERSDSTQAFSEDAQTLKKMAMQG